MFINKRAMALYKPALTFKTASESLQTASKQFDIRFLICDPNCLLVHVHTAYMVLALFEAPEVTTASKHPRRSSLTSHQISDPNFLLIHVHIVYIV